MSTETSAGTVDVTERLDAIVKQLDRIEEQLEENTERTEISAKFVAEIHATWGPDDRPSKILSPQPELKMDDRVSMGPPLGTVQWVSVSGYGEIVATVAWDGEPKPTAHLVLGLSRVTTGGV